MKPRQVREALEEWFSDPAGKSFLHRREEIIELAETVFFASLAAEENRPTEVMLVWTEHGASELKSLLDDDENLPSGEERERAWDVLGLEPRPLSVETLVKAAPLAEFGRSALSLMGMAGSFSVDGVARLNRRTDGGRCLVFLAEAPGVISLAFKREEIFRFERGSVAPPALTVLSAQGPVVTAIEQLGLPLESMDAAYGRGLKRSVRSERRLIRSGVPLRPILATSLLVVRGLLTAMSKTQHGGLMLFAPRELPVPGEDVKLPIIDREFLTLRVQSLLTAKAALNVATDQSLEAPLAEKVRLADDALDQAIDDVGRLTSVDNALLIGPGFSLLGLQYEVTAPRAPLVVQPRFLDDPTPLRYDMTRHGSRHRAAAAFAYAYPGALAFAASADGPIRCFLRQEQTVATWRIRLPPI